MPLTHMFAHHKGGQRQPTPGNIQCPSPTPITNAHHPITPRCHTHTELPPGPGPSSNLSLIPTRQTLPGSQSEQRSLAERQGSLLVRPVEDCTLGRARSEARQVDRVVAQASDPSAPFRSCSSLGFGLLEENRRAVQRFARLCSFNASLYPILLPFAPLLENNRFAPSPGIAACTGRSFIHPAIRGVRAAAR